MVSAILWQSVNVFLIATEPADFHIMPQRMVSVMLDQSLLSQLKRITSTQQGVALTGRNHTGTPCSFTVEL